MSDCPRAKASNRPTLALKPTSAMNAKNSVSKKPAASANASAIAGSAASRSPSSSEVLASGFSSAAFRAMTVKMIVTSIVMPKKRTIASQVTHLRQPCHLRISSGSSTSNIDPDSGIVSSSPACNRPRTRGMWAPMPAPLSRSHSVYHICCMPDGPHEGVAEVAQAADDCPYDGRADHQDAHRDCQQALDEVVDVPDDGEHDPDDEQADGRGPLP